MFGSDVYLKILNYYVDLLYADLVRNRHELLMIEFSKYITRTEIQFAYFIPGAYTTIVIWDYGDMEMMRYHSMDRDWFELP